MKAISFVGREYMAVFAQMSKCLSTISEAIRAHKIAGCVTAGAVSFLASLADADIIAGIMAIISVVFTYKEGGKA
ncbi:MAG: hypothetical protein K2M59_09910 [Muribaculaceae bacterium]|nr:hypothetical protein [Muribaculaceae bacterium]